MAMPEEPQSERREVHYSGRVQGVGFRYTVRSLAGRYDVSGFVMNLRDGRVQLVAEGRSGEVAGLIDAVRQAMGRYIHDEQQETGPPTGEFGGFEVRF
jgi:acylphosphatase